MWNDASSNSRDRTPTHLEWGKNWELTLGMVMNGMQRGGQECGSCWGRRWELHCWHPATLGREGNKVFICSFLWVSYSKGEVVDSNLVGEPRSDTTNYGLWWTPVAGGGGGTTNKASKSRTRTSVGIWTKRSEGMFSLPWRDRGGHIGPSWQRRACTYTTRLTHGPLHFFELSWIHLLEYLLSWLWTKELGWFSMKLCWLMWLQW